MKKRNSLFVAFLSLVVCIGCIFIAPNVKAAAVIEIDTAEELRKIGADASYPLTGSYKLTSDIDLSGTQWTPIHGTFTGVFDGDGHTVSGMTMGTPEAPYHIEAGMGMFETLGGTVKNLKLKDINYNVGKAGSYWPVGGVCGYARYGTSVIENVYVSGSITNVTSRQVRAGGIAGYCAAGTTTIKNCFVDVDILAEYNKTVGTGQLAGVAGIVGSADGGTITGCISIGDITLLSPGYVGALHSDYDGRVFPVTVTNSYSIGKLTYDRGTLMASSKAHMTTADKLLSSPKLSSAWTVENGKLPYLTSFGKDKTTLSDAVSAVKKALADLNAGIGVTEEEVLRAAVKAISSADATVSVKSLDRVLPTNEKEGSITASILVKVGSSSETVSKVYTLAKIPTLAYDFTTNVPGRANGTVTILTPNTYANEAYALYWGTSSGISDKYSSLTTMEDIEVNGKTLTYRTEPQTYIPSGITHLWLTIDGEPIVSLEIPAAHRMSLGTHKYTFGVLSDVHFGETASAADDAFKASMDIYKNEGAKFVISVGDLTNGGRETEYARFKSALSSYKMPFWAALGNHDILSWNLAPGLAPDKALQNLKGAIPTFANVNHGAGSDFTVSVADGKNAGYDYTMAYGDDLYVFLAMGVASNGNASANNDMKLDPEQIEWLEGVFNKYYNVDKKNGQVFLLFHFYTLESDMVVASPLYKEWDAASSKMLDTVLRKYPGVIHFSGHNHFYFDADMNIYDDGYTAIHVPSIKDPWPNYEGTEGSGTAYESYVVSVYDGYILINGVDAYTGQYAPHAMFMIETPENENADPECTHEYTEKKHDASEHWTVCAKCKAEQPGSRENHKGGTATCTAKPKCSVCGTEYGKANGHGTTEVRNAKTASCTEKGYTGDTYCKVCGDKIKSGTATDKKAHTYKDGKCTVCGTADSSQAPDTSVTDKPVDTTPEGNTRPEDTTKPESTTRPEDTTPEGTTKPEDTDVPDVSETEAPAESEDKGPNVTLILVIAAAVIVVGVVVFAVVKKDKASK